MLVMRPHKIWSMFKAVSAAPVFDSTFQAAWATDGWPNTPFKAPTGDGSLTISGPAGQVDLIVLSHHNLVSPATVAFGGTAAGAIVVPVARPNGIPYNIFVKLNAAVSMASLTITVSGNPTPFIIGEVLAGLSESFDLLSDDNSDTYNVGSIDHDDIDVSSVPGYDLPWDQRVKTGSNWATATEKAFLHDWLAAQRGNTRPSVIIPNPEENDAWTVLVAGGLSGKQIMGAPNQLHHCSMTFKEVKRSRW
jgi:hypothetical protein